MEQFNHKNNSKWEFLTPLKITFSLAMITRLGEIMSILLNGRQIIPTLQDLMRCLDTTMMTANKREMVNFQYNHHLNLKNTRITPAVRTRNR